MLKEKLNLVSTYNPIYLLRIVANRLFRGRTAALKITRISSESDKYSNEYKAYIDQQVAKTSQRANIDDLSKAAFYGRWGAFTEARKIIPPNLTGSALCVGCRDLREINFVKNLFPDINVSGLDLISLSPVVTVGDIHNIPFSNEVFDLVVANHVLEHSFDLEKAVSELSRIVKKNAFIICEIPVRFETSVVDRISLSKIQDLESIFHKFLKFRTCNSYDDMASPGIGRLIMQKL